MIFARVLRIMTIRLRLSRWYVHVVLGRVSRVMRARLILVIGMPDFCNCIRTVRNGSVHRVHAGVDSELGASQPMAKWYTQ